MEFERAVYRVYERCVDGLRDEDREGEVRTNSYDSKSCKIIEFFLILTLLFFFTTFLTLHFTFVGSQGCLPALLTPHIIASNYSIGKILDNGKIELNQDIMIYISINEQYKVKTGLNDLSNNNNNDDAHTSSNTRYLKENNFILI